MSYKPNKLGFYDLGGNVSEWCDDWYDETRQGKVIRGGDFDTFSQYLLRSNMRLPRPSTTPQGFRVVLELP
jgi:formylglycine-generating enzyme required for sulfatase activity